MKIMRIALIIAFYLMTYTASVTAAARTWEIDKGHSNFYFSVDHVFSKVRGHFNEFSGSIQFDPENLAESSMRFTIETKSIDTNIGKRDKHLQSEDFFDAGKYPTMEFVSESITANGENVYEVKGKFTVKGQAYDLMFPMTLAGVKDHPAEKGKLVAGFNGGLVMDRLAYKIGTGKFVDYGVVGKDVEILVSLEVLSDK